MPAPTVVTFSLEALTDANNALVGLLDGGVMRFYTEDDEELAGIPLESPAGIVAYDTGQLTLDFTSGPHYAIASGVCTYATIEDSFYTVHVTLPVEQGTAPVPGKLVLSSLVFVNGVPLDIISATVG
jgi:hypothetical protein